MERKKKTNENGVEDDNKNDDNNNEIVPREIDTHFQMYGKHAWEVEYGERCPTCNKRIDEFGFCACGGSI
ncbi:MAG TPA: hypothetical protein VJP79_01960 [Nitrososphaera sp.]|nr:hypothetical protein [Nitrososphaera sp.]